MKKTYHKPKLIGSPKKLVRPHPVIELVGAPDIGKSLIAPLVAKRLGGTHLSFPILDPTSATGSILMSSLTKNIALLERAPQWWAHIYVANLYEQKYYLEKLRAVGPVVVTNYIASFRVFSKSIEVSPKMQGFTSGLPEPTDIFHLFGEEWLNRPTNLKLDYSEQTRYDLRRSFNTVKIPRSLKVKFPPLSSKTLQVNLVAAEISAILAKKYKIKEDFSATYYKNQFDL